jgi:hypothetical protein
MKLEIPKKIAVSFSSLGALAIVLGGLIFAALITTSQSADGIPIHHVNAIPAFARKYGLPCSACHTAWPMLNNFGQVFRDNGYQLGNDRDSPITRDASYFPATIRITPQWHRESSDHQAVDATPGDATTTGAGKITTAGFDLSGMDMWFGGTLYKNISFIVLPSANSAGQFHFESAFVRFDNLLNTSWLNFKFGRFELDTPVSEKRFLQLSTEGGLYYSYHFKPFGDSNVFGGIGDNQLGVELLGHSSNSYRRYSFSVVSSNDGAVGLPAGKTVDFYGNFSQAFNLGTHGLERIGAYAYFGRSPTFFQTSGGSAIAGTGTGNEPFYRAGAYSVFMSNRWIINAVYLHGYENKFLANATADNNASGLPVGARSASWNSGFVDVDYQPSPQLIFTSRFELVRMAQQGNPTLPGNMGNLDAVTFGYRWYPIMFSRAGLAWFQEYSFNRARGATIINGSGISPSFNGHDTRSSSYIMGFDFDF